MANYVLNYTGEQIDEAVELALNSIDIDFESSNEGDTNPINSDTLNGYTVELLINKIYPIGSIYISINPTNPNTLFGGSWEQIKDTFLLSAGDTYVAGVVGGEATHTLIENELPAVSGTVDFRPWSTGTPYTHAEGAFSTLGEQSNTAVGFSSSGTEDGYRRLKYSFGGGAAHNNMPPYLVVYIWKRIA